MAKISIFGPGLQAEDIQILRGLLAQIPCREGPIGVVQTIGDSGVDDAVIVLLGIPKVCTDPDLEKRLSPVVGTPQRAIWVWPQGSPESLPPIAAKKYCYSTVPWDAQKLSAVICDDDVTCFEGPDGKPLPKVEVDRNLCVVEEKGK